MSLPASSERVRVHTADHVNDRIHTETLARIERLAREPDDIDRRLQALDCEWDVERLLETNAASLTLLGLGMAIAGRRGWLALSVAVSGFLLQHGLQGWCPPLPVLRRMGVRTAREIEAERHALLMLRGLVGGPEVDVMTHATAAMGRAPRTGSHAVAHR